MIRFIDEHRNRFTVEFIFTTLKINVKATGIPSVQSPGTVFPPSS